MTGEEARKRYPTGVQPRLRRVLRLFVRLQTSSRNATVETLCRELDVSRRTLFRDMKLLRDCGVQISYQPRTNTYRVGRIIFPRTLTDHDSV